MKYLTHATQNNLKCLRHKEKFRGNFDIGKHTDAFQCVTMVLRFRKLFLAAKHI